MPRSSSQPKDILLNVRIDPELKSEFARAASAQHRTVAEVLRELMRAYVEGMRRRSFQAEARRQSKLIANSPDEAEVMRWIEDVSGSEARQ